ncbi:MAG: hypothetical protein ACRDZ8_13960 [Acidimicrobiales bacterium]
MEELVALIVVPALAAAIEFAVFRLLEWMTGAGSEALVAPA